MKKIFYSLCILAGLAACDKNPEQEDKPDTEKPFITLVDSKPAPATGIVCELPEDKIFTVFTGENLSLHLKFTDDKELSQYKIDVHNNFDCHSHRQQTPGGVPWFLVRIRDLSGSDSRVEELLQVPENATVGDYHLLVYCTDKAGTEAEPLVYSIKVRNAADTAPPQVTFTSPASEEVTAQKGSILTFQANVTDNLSLNNGRVELSYHDPAGTLFSVEQVYFGNNAGKQTTFSLPFQIETYAATGPHLFHVQVFDEKNNAVKKTFKVNIQP